MENLILVFSRLDYDYSTFTLDHFTDHVAGFVRKEILLIPYKLERTLSGIWVNTETAHYIFFNTQLHHILQTHTILHEIAHIVLNHKSRSIDHYLDDDILKQYTFLHPVGKARTTSPINSVDDEEEREAEEFVFLVQHQLMILNQSSKLFGDNQVADGLRQFTQILE
jgi:hypothetical protein